MTCRLEMVGEIYGDFRLRNACKEIDSLEEGVEGYSDTGLEASATSVSLRRSNQDNATGFLPRSSNIDDICE